RGELPLIGRDSEMTLLAESAESARIGRGRVVQLTGEAGAGKSRLIDEALQAAADMVVLSVRAEMYRASTPYAVTARLLGEALAIPPNEKPATALARVAGVIAVDRPDLMAWLPLLAEALGADMADTPESAAVDPRFRRAKLTELTSALLTMVLRTPTVMVVDDAHAVDEASAEVLDGLARDTASRPWLVVTGRRPVSSGFLASEAPHVAEVEVPPLAPEHSRALAEAATETSPLPPHDIEALVDRSAGNPLFLMDLIAAVPTLGVDSLPASLEDVVTVRIDLLAPGDRAVLRYGSVIGTSFTEADLRTVVGDESVSADEAIWERLAEFVQPGADGTFSFRQALVRDVAYGQLPFRTRRELHARFADAILGSAGRELNETELLAVHFFQAGRYDQAWRFSRLAGDRARRKYANAEARRFYRQALDSGRRLHGVSGEELAVVQESLGEVTERLGDFSNAQAAYRAARRLLPDDAVAQGRLLLKEAWIPHRLGRYAVALRTLTRGLRALEGVAG